MRPILIAILATSHYLITSCNDKAPVSAPPTAEVETQNYSPEMIESMIASLNNFMTDTPYSALIQETTVSAAPYTGPDGDYYKQTVTVTAKVLETFRGSSEEHITFIGFEEGEVDLTPQAKPYIITLCQSDNEYYRLDVGANIPATKAVLAAAKQISKSLDPKQAAFSDCD